MSQDEQDFALVRLLHGKKYKNEPIGKIPLDYLVWAEAKMTRLPVEFRAKLTQYLARPEFAEEAERLRHKLEDAIADVPHVMFTLPGGNEVELRLSRRVTKTELAKIIKTLEQLAPLSLLRE